MPSTRAEPGAHSLTVLTGLNAGLELPLSGDRYTIGGMPDDTIRLDGFAQSAARFAINGGKLRLRAEIDGVLANGRTCKRGRSMALDLPTRLRLSDDTEIFIASTEAQHLSSRHGGWVRMAGLAGLTAALVLSVFPIQFAVEPTNSASANLVSEPLTPVADPEPAVEQACNDCAAEAEMFLKSRLSEAGITTLVTRIDDGAVRVTGQIASDKRPAWDIARVAFDREYAASVPLLHEISTLVEAAAPISIASVWLGSPREVASTRGVAYRIGDPIEDGWVLSAIEIGYIALSRSDKTMLIRY